MKAVSYAIYATSVIYIAIALLGVFFFGSRISESILINVSLHAHWDSYVLRIIFLLVLGCHIPFIFFSGKESVLISIDEYNRKSISNALLQKSVGVKVEPAPQVSDIQDQFFTESLGQNAQTGDVTINSENAQKKGLAYKEMPYHIYFTATCILYFSQMLGAIYILDIGLIFEFVSAISVSALAFIFPGAFWLISMAKYGTNIDRQEKKKDRYAAWFFVIFGIFMLLFQLAFSIYEMVEDAEGHGGHEGEQAHHHHEGE